MEQNYRQPPVKSYERKRSQGVHVRAKLYLKKAKNTSVNGRRGLAFSMNHYNLSLTIKIPNDEIAQGSLAHVIDFLDQLPRAWYACAMIKNQRNSLFAKKRVNGV